VPADGKIPAAQTAGSFPITISYTNPETGGTTVTVDHTVSVVETGIGGTYKKTYKVGGVEFNMMYVPTGKFQRDTTATNVTVVDRPYRMAETETSLALFNAVMSKKLNSNGEWVTDTGYNRSGTLTNPAGTISFYDAIAFCNKLSVRLGKKPVYSVSTVPDWGKLEFSQIPAVRSGGTPSGNGNADWHAVAWNDDADHDGFRLPTEWEWMWAEIGATNRTADGNGVVVLPDYNDVWSGQEIAGAAFDDYVKYGNTGVAAATGKLPNSLGLYNMSGNMMEVCWDKIESSGTTTDPKWPTGEKQTSLYKGGTGNNRAETGGNFQESDTNIKKFVNRSVNNAPHYARWSNQGFRFVINQ
jgi:formylglycine-generating enzyme required for sulfatase activity